MSNYQALHQTFREAADLADPTERRGFLLDRIQAIYDKALARSYRNKSGEEIANPDGLVALKCVEVVGRWAGYDAEANMQAAANLARAKQLGSASDIELLNQVLDQVPADMLLAALKKREAIAALPERRGKRNGQQFDTTASEQSEQLEGETETEEHRVPVRSEWE